MEAQKHLPEGVTDLIVPKSRIPQPKKDAEVRAWLVVSESGLSNSVELGKHAIKRRTGLPARALRVLDPIPSHPTAVVVRGRAIALNLEPIRAVITATEVLVLYAKNPLVAPFVEQLQRRATEFHRTQSLTMKSGDTRREITVKAKQNSPSTNPSSTGASEQLDISSENCTTNVDVKGNSILTSNASKIGASKVLPFEFRSLEVCLEYVCSFLESEAIVLEQEAYPMLDELTTEISTLNLERVRLIKSRLSSVHVRVEKVRDVLQHLLDSDMDMAEMYLTDKDVRQQLEETSLEDKFDCDAFELVIESFREENLKSMAQGGTEISSPFKPNIEELEMLLEAYLIEIKGTQNKLLTLREYVDDTEDYTKITLDDKQNQLLQIKILLSTITLLAIAGQAVVNALAVNVRIHFFASGTTQFIEVGTGVVACILILYALAIMCYSKFGVLM